MLSPIKTATRAAILAIALGGAALTAMPVQAQPSVEFNFSIGGGRGHWDGPGRPGRFCMSDREVRRLVQRNGFRDIRFTDRRGRIVQVRAERGRRDYRITVDSCRGRIVDIDRLRGR